MCAESERALVTQVENVFMLCRHDKEHRTFAYAMQCNGIAIA